MSKGYNEQELTEVLNDFGDVLSDKTELIQMEISYQ